MKSRRIHVKGASGSGATSLGRALADAPALRHHPACEPARKSSRYRPSTGVKSAA
jgi:cytidylate kinase